MINSSNFTNIIPSVQGFDPRVGSASPMLAPSSSSSFDPRVGSSAPMFNQGFLRPEVSGYGSQQMGRGNTGGVAQLAELDDEEFRKALAEILTDNKLAQGYARANRAPAAPGGRAGVNRNPQAFSMPRTLMSAPLNMSYNPLIRTG